MKPTTRKIVVACLAAMLLAGTPAAPTSAQQRIPRDRQATTTREAEPAQKSGPKHCRQSSRRQYPDTCRWDRLDRTK